MATVVDLKIPGRTTAAGRSSSITNAFINAPLPYLEPTHDEKLEILRELEIAADNVCCAYCGDSATEWDHFYPTVKNRKETGFFTEKANLVPACGKCNQSKGNKDWELWIRSSAPLAPYKRGVPDLERRISVLRKFASQYPARRIDISKIRESQEWQDYEALREEIVQKLRKGDEMAKSLAKAISRQANLGTRESLSPAIPIAAEGDT